MHQRQLRQRESPRKPQACHLRSDTTFRATAVPPIRFPRCLHAGCQGGRSKRTLPPRSVRPLGCRCCLPPFVPTCRQYAPGKSEPFVSRGSTRDGWTSSKRTNRASRSISAPSGINPGPVPSSFLSPRGNTLRAACLGSFRLRPVAWSGLASVMGPASCPPAVRWVVSSVVSSGCPPTFHILFHASPTSSTSWWPPVCRPSRRHPQTHTPPRAAHLLQQRQPAIGFKVAVVTRVSAVRRWTSSARLSRTIGRPNSVSTMASTRQPMSFSITTSLRAMPEAPGGGDTVDAPVAGVSGDTGGQAPLLALAVRPFGGVVLRPARGRRPHGVLVVGPKPAKAGLHFSSFSNPLASAWTVRGRPLGRSCLVISYRSTSSLPPRAPGPHAQAPSENAPKTHEKILTFP